MTDDRADLVLEILKQIQGDIASVKREQTSLATRMLAMEDHQRGMITSLHGLLTSIHGVQVDVGDIKVRLDRIETRLNLAETEH